MLFIGMALSVTAQQVQLQVVTKRIEKTIVYKTGNHVYIKGEKAEVMVETWDKSKVEVVMKLIAKHPDRKIAAQDLEKMHHQIEKKGTEIIIKNYIEPKEGANKPLANLKANYIVYVPMDCPVTLDNYFGKANIQNLSSNLSLESEFCSIGLANIKGDVGIKTRFGDIIGELIEGNVNIEARRSNITLSRLTGKFDINAKYGIISIFADESYLDLNINADKSDVYFYDASLAAYNYALASLHGKITTPKRMNFEVEENENGLKKANFRPSAEMSGVRVAINVSFGEIRIAENQ